MDAQVGGGDILETQGRADSKQGPMLLKQHLPEECHPALVEIIPYFLGGFGSGQRLDYGTGHELSFAAFLCTLFLLRILDPAMDSVATALVMFPRYSWTNHMF